MIRSAYVPDEASGEKSHLPRAPRSSNLADWVIRNDPTPINAAVTKILVVDDSKAMRMIVLRTLRQAGFGAAFLIAKPFTADAFEHLLSEVA